MRVATWNLWWRFGPWQARQPAIEATLADVDADIVMLQETWVVEGGRVQAALLADALGMHHAVAEVRAFDGLGMANAVLSRWPMASAETIPLPGPDGSPGVRHVLWCTIESPLGLRYAASAHLEHRFDQSALRQRQVAALAEAVAARRPNPETSFPVVVGGDLNAVPDSDEIRALTGRAPPPVPGLVFTDAWEVAGSGPGWTWDRTNPHQRSTAWPRRRLDYLLVSWPRPKPVGNPRTCSLAGVEPVEGVQPSDHYAVVADLVVDEGDSRV